jgi:CheY-like chemotaxis protein
MPIEHAVDCAMLGGVRRLALFHHDPTRDDAAIDRLWEQACRRATGCHSALEVYAAAEGQEIEVLPQPQPARATTGPIVSALRPAMLDGGGIALIADADEAHCRLLEPALRDEGLQVVSATNGHAALQLARQHQPAVILLDMTLPGLDGLALCRLLRAEAASPVSQVPILLLTDIKLAASDVVEAFAAGATDYLTTPVKPTLIRSRVRIWLQRTQARAGEEGKSDGHPVGMQALAKVMPGKV